MPDSIPRLFLISSLALAYLLVHYAGDGVQLRSIFWIAAGAYLAQYATWFLWRTLVPKNSREQGITVVLKGGGYIFGQFLRIRKDWSGQPAIEWINTIPNAGLIYYTIFFNAPRVLLTTPAALAEVLQQKSYVFIKPPQFKRGISRILGDGILLAEGDEHKAQRKNLMPAFSYRHIKDLYPVFWSKARDLVQAIEFSIKTPSEVASEDPSDPAVVEIGQWASRATLDIIGLAGMGQDFNNLENKDNTLATTYRSLFKPPSNEKFLIALAILFPDWLLVLFPFERNVVLNSAQRVIRKTCRDLIREKKEKMEKQQDTGVDILSVALKSGGFSEANMVDQLMTFMAAGHETTASSLIWAAYCLCKHPKVQERLREEVRANLPSVSDSGTVATAANIDSLAYLHAVCHEVLRVFPPVPLTFREASEDTTILGQTIPAGTAVVIAPWAINKSVELWGEDADEFNPERWLGPGRANTGGANSNYAFLTFLHGPHGCIGQGFAKAEFACLLAALVGRFEMELADKDFKLEVRGTITSKPADGLRLRLKLIDGW
ncbi:MAG: hypothetical protein M1825_000557 [Sarcosagium campestre]|nr:MAG: hypothetical protein M1825_000557 [Sarcosagium campestre]